MTRIVARHPVLAFMVISLGVGFLTAAVRPIAEADVLPFGMPLHTVRFLIFIAVILLAGATVIIATRGRLGRAKEDPRT